MSTGSCEHARGQVALAAIGRLPDNERLALQSHLDGCADCRSELADLQGLDKALSAAQPDLVDQVVTVPESLKKAVLGSLETEVARHRRSARMRFTGIAAAIVLVVGASVVTAEVVSASHRAPGGPTFALVGTGGASGTVQLTAEPWGTSVQLRASGEPEGQVLTLSMRADDGSWWVAGSYLGVTDSELNVTMSCPVPVADIDGVRVTDSSGKQVLGSYES
jgi:hypothetical protein